MGKIERDPRREYRLKVFVSYSRKDIQFADQLVMALEDNGFDPVIDHHDIAPGEAWRPRLGKLIRSADAIIFVLDGKIRRDRRVCAWEVEEASSLGKRVIPAVPDPFHGENPANLGDFNRIFFYPDEAVSGSGFYDGVRKLVEALSIDHRWVRQQTALMQRAEEWIEAGKPDDLLLRGVACPSSNKYGRLSGFPIGDSGSSFVPV